jgi:hypothetical protein
VPTDNKFYVDPSAPSSAANTGSSACPFQSLDNALAKIGKPSVATTICTKGTFDSSNGAVWPRYIAKNIELDGTNCLGDGNPHTIFNVPSGNRGVVFNQNAPGSIHGYDIIYQGATKDQTGIYITNTGGTDRIQIHDVTINGFQYGIHVGHYTGDASGGHAYIFRDSHINMNDTGLYVNNDGIVDINVTSATTSHAEFNQNTSTGISVSDTAQFNVKGAVYTGTGAGTSGNARTVRADNNGANGLAVTSTAGGTTAPTLNLDFFSASNNTGSSSFSGLGAYIANNVKATVTNSVFNNNTHGVFLYDSNGTDASSINFGTGPSGSTAGLNVFESNSNVGFYVFFDNDAPINLQGNTFGTMKVCSGGSTGPNKLTAGTDMTAAYDIGGINGGDVGKVLANVQGCTKTNCNGVASGTNGCP